MGAYGCEASRVVGHVISLPGAFSEFCRLRFPSVEMASPWTEADENNVPVILMKMRTFWKAARTDTFD